MKKSELKYIIKEAIEAPTMEIKEPYNEIGEIILVMKPVRNRGIGEMIKKASIYDTININEIMGAYMGNNMSEAKKAAKEGMKAYEAQKKALENEMASYRDAKKSVEEKRRAAKELIEKLR